MRPMRFTVALCLVLSLTFCTRVEGFRYTYPTAEGVELVEENASTPGNKIAHIIFSNDVNSSSIATALRLMQEAQAMKPHAIILEINSRGGEVDSGMRLIKSIEASPVPVHCLVDGNALSMGFAILQACHTRTATFRSALMTHEASINTSLQGPEKDYRNFAEHLRVVTEGLSRHCSKRLSMTFEQYKDKIRNGQDWWMTPEEALKVDALDAIVFYPSFMLQTLREEGTWPPMSRP